MSNGIREVGDGSSVYNGITVNSPVESNSTGASVQVEDFLNLMIAQLTNQDMLNPADDTQYVTQLAQFATMQAMQEMMQYSQTNYATSLVGKTVTVASLSLGGNVNSDTGVVTKVDLSGDEFTVTVNGKIYTLNQIMQVADTDNATSQNDLDAANKITPIITSIGSDKVSLRWDHPVTGEDKQNGLRYDVYYTDNGQLDFTTLAGVKKGELAGENMKETSLTIDDLEPGKTYFINIVVTDAAGNQAIYQRATINTKSA